MATGKTERYYHLWIKDGKLVSTRWKDNDGLTVSEFKEWLKRK